MFGDIHLGIGGTQQAVHIVAIRWIHRNPNAGRTFERVVFQRERLVKTPLDAFGYILYIGLAANPRDECDELVSAVARQQVHVAKLTLHS